jgi:hypothetical protein
VTRCSADQSAASNGRSGGQALTAFGAASVDDGAATLACHPGTKTVAACALQSAGLKGTLHDGNLKIFAVDTLAGASGELFVLTNCPS